MTRLPQSWDEELLTPKELAAKLKRARSYVAAMQSRGFRFLAGRTTLSIALEWLSDNPQPRSRKRAGK